MNALFTAEDHAFIRRENRRIDASGVEAEKTRKIVEFRQQTAEMNKEKAAAKAQQAADLLRANLLRPLVSLAEMEALTVAKIVDQLSAYRARGVPDILAMSKYKVKADKLAALRAAYHWYQSNMASAPPPTVPSSTVEPSVQIIDDWAADEDVEMDE
ncbi:hypothetical protein R3P38DRAFT_2543811 [Favolaschia claudopus]|uniref:Uncharacterized protein n=1 Tax=Favolaschia claudopus TaxID=2862362 RepID=A0AAW0AR35_9AGAR